MSIPLCIAIGVLLLYFWLIGHWFARVLAFLPLAGLLMMMNDAVKSPEMRTAWLCLAPFVAWLIASLPIYYRRHRFQQWCAKQQARGMQEYGQR